jgi:hypothetical protein
MTLRDWEKNRKKLEKDPVDHFLDLLCCLLYEKRIAFSQSGGVPLSLAHYIWFKVGSQTTREIMI